MTDSITKSALLGALAFLLEEALPGHSEPGSVFLDSGTGWRATLETVTHHQASTPTVPGGTTIAGHVEHTRYYLQVAREFIQGRTEPVDWTESWQVSEVSEHDWSRLQSELIAEHDSVMALARNSDDWDEDLIASMFGMVAHCAYHLGAVRQMIKR